MLDPTAGEGRLNLKQFSFKNLPWLWLWRAGHFVLDQWSKLYFESSLSWVSPLT